MTLRPALLACALALATLSTTAPAAEKYRSAQEILAQSPASDWRTLDPSNTLYMDLEGGTVVIELAPAFAPEHVDTSAPWPAAASGTD